jgi:L-2-amino-thiazoline-4-carboxylic acid hydrolase
MSSFSRQAAQIMRAASRHGRPLRSLSSSTPPPPPPASPPAAAKHADEIMSVSANKAFRYIFTRTLPLRSQPELSGESLVECTVTDIESAAARIVGSHAHRAVDDRAAVHLHAAALAVATHRALLARLRDEARVIGMLRGAFGAGRDVSDDAKLPGHWVGKAALMFSPDRMAAVRRMTENAARDFGETFSVERVEEEEGRRHRMTVSKCLYADVCREEGLPHLTQLFCSLDRAMFSHVTEKAHGVRFRFDEDSTLAKGPETPCEFAFERVAAKTGNMGSK